MESFLSPCFLHLIAWQDITAPGEGVGWGGQENCLLHGGQERAKNKTPPNPCPTDLLSPAAPHLVKFPKCCFQGTKHSEFETVGNISQSNYNKNTKYIILPSFQYSQSLGTFPYWPRRGRQKKKGKLRNFSKTKTNKQN